MNQTANSNTSIQKQQKEILNINDLSELTGYSKAQIYQFTHKRKIPFYKPLGGKLFFKRKEITDFLFSNRVATDEEIAREATKMSMA